MPHKEELPATIAIPPFPEPGTLPEAELQRLPLSKLLDRDPETEDKLFSHCQSQGFFYLDLTESQRGKELINASNLLQDLSAEAFNISHDEKFAVSQGTLVNGLFGFKKSGAIAKDDTFKRKDVGEFFNVAKDDIIGNYDTGVKYPPLIRRQVPMLFNGFANNAHKTGLAVLDVLARKLGLSPDVLLDRHRITQRSGDHVRLTYGPGDPSASDIVNRSEENTRITTYGHTDFGSVTLLFNWLGGLQIEDPDSKEWKWVRPLPGHAICNLGDAMVVFSGGKLKSGKHRVVAAPGEQARLDRYSVVYFVRPENEVIMEDLTYSTHGEERKRFTAEEWIVERARSLGVDVKTDKS